MSIMISSKWSLPCSFDECEFTEAIFSKNVDMWTYEGTVVRLYGCMDV